MARDKRPNYQISGVSGQVVLGEGNVTVQGSTVDASVTGQDARALAEAFRRLRERVDEVAGSEAGRAKERVDDARERAESAMGYRQGTHGPSGPGGSARTSSGARRHDHRRGHGAASCSINSPTVSAEPEHR
jgi:hypothetical protein